MHLAYGSPRFFERIGTIGSVCGTCDHCFTLPVGMLDDERIDNECIVGFAPFKSTVVNDKRRVETLASIVDYSGDDGEP